VTAAGSRPPSVGDDGLPGARPNPTPGAIHRWRPQPSLPPSDEQSLDAAGGVPGAPPDAASPSSTKSEIEGTLMASLPGAVSSSEADTKVCVTNRGSSHRLHSSRNAKLRLPHSQHSQSPGRVRPLDSREISHAVPSGLGSWQRLQTTRNLKLWLLHDGQRQSPGRLMAAPLCAWIPGSGSAQ